VSSSQASAAAAAAPPSKVAFATALAFWLKLGLISFGGPAGQIAIMHSELVERRRWISERRFLHALNYCMVLPGPEAQQLATYLGWLLHRTWGGLAAGLLFVLPSLLLLILLSWIYIAYGDNVLVAGLFYGIKPAVVAIVLHAAWRIGTRTLRHPALWTIAAAAFAALFVFGAPFPLIVLLAALIGTLLGRWRPAWLAGGAARAATSATAGAPALIDDDTPVPPHARPLRARWPSVLLAGVGLWAVALAALTARYGWDGLLTQMGWFFTKAALLTFGGAYAVLPYVYQAAVEHYGWLSGPQMIAGLALGETTPGPLIMVVAFVGFVGAWQAPVMESLFWSGVAGAVIVTFFTFLPSFIFIFAGAPLIESTRGDLRFTAPLTAITAAVVGVIVNLALFFAGHVFWPQGTAAALDWTALVLAAAAAVALFRFKQGVIPVIAACALAGLSITALARIA
jgi:chromate transporter